MLAHLMSCVCMGISTDSRVRPVVRSWRIRFGMTEASGDNERIRRCGSTKGRARSFLSTFGARTHLLGRLRDGCAQAGKAQGQAVEGLAIQDVEAAGRHGVDGRGAHRGGATEF